MSKYQWAARGDINAFFGLMLDNLTVLVLLLGLITQPGQFTPEFVLGLMVPGTALGVLLGDLVYTVMAFRLARRTGKFDITAMPLGLDTPSTFAVAPLVLLPALAQAQKDGLNHEHAMLFAWHVGAAVLLMVGVFKTIVAPMGNLVRRWVPSAALLGSLAAIALALIAMEPLLDVAAVPLAGLPALAVILAALVAHRALPGQFPGALAAVLVGVAIYYGCVGLDGAFGWTLVPSSEGTKAASVSMPSWPDAVWQWDWWQRVLTMAAEKMPIILPFALATIVGGIDCTESAAAAGDEYDTGSILLTEGIASVVAGLAGGVIQTTPYIGHPAYKAMGGRAAYTLATALFIGIVGIGGGFTTIFAWLPRAVMFPILVFVGLEITAQSFHATPHRHYPALALAVLPALAALVMGLFNEVHHGNPPVAIKVETLRCLSNGFIITSVLWATVLAMLIDGRMLTAMGNLLAAALCSLFGIMHSPLPDAPIAWPWDVINRMAELIEAKRLSTAAIYQSPYHWAGAYALAALVVLGFALWPGRKQLEEPGEPGAVSHRSEPSAI